MDEDSLGADDTPDDGGGTKYLSVVADEAIFLCGSPHAFKVDEHPRLHAKLSGGGEDSGDDLGPEHGTRRLEVQVGLRNGKGGEA